MNTLLRAGLGALLGLTLVFGTAFAIEYDDIFEMTANGASDEEIVRRIVEDGRGFELSAREVDDLRDAGVSDIVIDTMRDPELGRDWLEGDDRDDYDDGRYEGGSGYSTSLDEAYGQGYSDGRTSLVFSFGYYYGPLSRYYYDDPFYYSFWSAGYAYSYWPSYYAYWYRPAYAWSYAYPYNYYTYDSFYCHTYYDPGYWAHNGYTVLPGYGRTVWDDGPRWRDGGIAPPKGGRPAAIAGLERLRDNGRANRLRNPAVPAIREAIAWRTPSQRRSTGDLGLPVSRRPSDRTADARLREVTGRRTVERGTVARNEGRGVKGVREVTKGRVVRSSPARGERVARGTTPHVERSSPRSVERGTTPRILRGNARAERGTSRSVERSSPRRIQDRIERRAAPQRPSQEARRSQVREREFDRGESRREAPRAEAPRRGHDRVEAPEREVHRHVEQAPPPRQREEAPPPAQAKEERGGGRANDMIERVGGRGRGGR